ncbi:hypothetical protein MOD25_06160 [Bacillus haynesii]|nr:hypothetical protein [Bacillus haynesii]MCY8549488.1 hypothetical protein [Bacillus haynesii]
MSQLNKVSFIQKDFDENDVEKALTYCYQLIWNDLRLNGVLNGIINRVEE